MFWGGSVGDMGELGMKRKRVYRKAAEGQRKRRLGEGLWLACRLRGQWQVGWGWTLFVGPGIVRCGFEKGII